MENDYKFNYNPYEPITSKTISNVYSHFCELQCFIVYSGFQAHYLKSNIGTIWKWNVKCAEYRKVAWQVNFLNITFFGQTTKGFECFTYNFFFFNCNTGCSGLNIPPTLWPATKVSWCWWWFSVSWVYVSFCLRENMFTKGTLQSCDIWSSHIPSSVTSKITEESKKFSLNLCCSFLACVSYEKSNLNWFLIF